MSAQINVVSDDHSKTSKNNIFKYYIFKYIFKHKNINFNIFKVSFWKSVLKSLSNEISLIWNLFWFNSLKQISMLICHQAVS